MIAPDIGALNPANPYYRMAFNVWRRWEFPYGYWYGQNSKTVFQLLVILGG